MLTRADVERIIENVLTELRIEVSGGDFTMPNYRTVKLKLGDRVISEDSFDVVQTREYEG